MVKRLTNRKKEILKEFVDFTCENCHKMKESKELQIHRINRGYMGGEYVMTNIKVICHDCHKALHYGEFR